MFFVLLSMTVYDFSALSNGWVVYVFILLITKLLVYKQ